MRRTLILALAALGLLFVVAAGAAPGHLDQSFGHHGVVLTALSRSDTYVSSLAIQRNGRILVAGDTGNRIGLARYTRRGRLDRSFGKGGIVSPKLGRPAEALAIALQPDGKVLVAGAIGEGSNNPALLARFNSDGSLDSTFGSGGLVETTLGGQVGAVLALALQPDGKIVAGGITFTANPTEIKYAVARFDANGAVDATFGTGGVVNAPSPADISGAEALALQPDGRILVGLVDISESQSVELYHGFEIIRLRPDGSVDPSFGSNGHAVATIKGGGALAAMTLRPNGDIVAAGSTISRYVDETDPHENVALARFRASGSPDGSFGKRGVVVTKLGGHAAAYDLVVLPGGKIVAVGSRERFGPNHVTVIRYRKNGSLDRRFGRKGVAGSPFASGYDEAVGAALQSNSRLVVAGSRLGENLAKTRSKVLLLRYLMK
jgi:uncharacterized delta-60 repeat protein